MELFASFTRSLGVLGVGQGRGNGDVGGDPGDSDLLLGLNKLFNCSILTR